MANDFTRMQKLAGIIKENQHKEMDESKMDGNPVKKLVNLLNQTIKIADENIPNAHNFDLEDFSQTLEGYVDELTSIGKFETYDEKMDEVKHEEDESKMNEAEKMNESILKIYIYDPSSYKLEDVKTYSYPSEEEAKKAAVAYNWQIAYDNGDTNLSKEEYVKKYTWDDLDDLSYDDYGYEILK